MIRVAIVEDIIILREKICALLNKQSDMQCIFQAGSLNELFLLNAKQESDPDILLLDISLGDQNSLDDLHDICDAFPRTKIIILTGHEDSEMLMEALQKGASSYAIKSQDPNLLLQIIRITHEGGAYIEPKLAKPVVLSLATPPPPAHHFPSAYLDLNLREKQIMNGLIDGKSYEEIGRAYNIGINTVRAYVKSLYRKLGVHSKIQLIQKINLLD